VAAVVLGHGRVGPDEQADRRADVLPGPATVIAGAERMGAGSALGADADSAVLPTSLTAAGPGGSVLASAVPDPAPMLAARPRVSVASPPSAPAAAMLVKFSCCPALQEKKLLLVIAAQMAATGRDTGKTAVSPRPPVCGAAAGLASARADPGRRECSPTTSACALRYGRSPAGRPLSPGPCEAPCDRGGLAGRGVPLGRPAFSVPFLVAGSRPASAGCFRGSGG